MDWLLLVYKIPREPTAGRVYVWRKLKQLGAIAVQDAVWVLPATPRTREQFQWLAAEIAELGGEVSLFTSQAVLSRQQESLEEQFEAPVRAAYGEILAALKRRNPDLAALSKRYQQVQVQDHFQCPLASKVRQRLLSAQEDQ
ncbi:MAG TPA: Chromate resistance protein ChrB [Pirellulaceae bacterium]|nr:Chromate resistance protein ChrB [Pirellulaceae bacterium]